MATAATSFVYNHDVAGIHRRINRFVTEMIGAASNPQSQVSSFDQTRLTSYLNAVKTYHDWVVAQPQLDLPETNPREYPLEDNPAVPGLENESLRDVIVMMELCRDELVNSQSARMPCGLMDFDSTRSMAIVAKIENFLTEYIATVTPLDLPESSPMRSISGAGKTGV